MSFIIYADMSHLKLIYVPFGTIRSVISADYKPVEMLLGDLSNITSSTNGEGERHKYDN